MCGRGGRKYPEVDWTGMRSPLLVLPLMSGVMWGLAGVFVRELSAHGMDTATIVITRTALSALMMLLLILSADRRMLRIRGGDLWLFVACALSMLGLNFLYTVSVDELTLSLAAVLLSLSPLFMLLMARVMFGDRITSRKALCMVLSVAGCVLVSGALENGGTLSAAGVLAGLSAAFFYALYGIISKKASSMGYSTYTILFYCLLISTVAVAPFADLGAVAGFASEGVREVGFLVLHAAVASFLPYILYTVAMARADAGTSSLLAACGEPAAAAVSGVVFFSESLSPLMMLGMAVVLVSISVMCMPHRPGSPDGGSARSPQRLLQVDADAVPPDPAGVAVAPAPVQRQGPGVLAVGVQVDGDGALGHRLGFDDVHDRRADALSAVPVEDVQLAEVHPVALHDAAHVPDTDAVQEYVAVAHPLGDLPPYGLGRLVLLQELLHHVLGLVGVDLPEYPERDLGELLGAVRIYGNELYGHRDGMGGMGDNGVWGPRPRPHGEGVSRMRAGSLHDPEAGMRNRHERAHPSATDGYALQVLREGRSGRAVLLRRVQDELPGLRGEDAEAWEAFHPLRRGLCNRADSGHAHDGPGLVRRAAADPHPPGADDRRVPVLHAGDRGVVLAQNVHQYRPGARSRAGHHRARPAALPHGRHPIRGNPLMGPAAVMAGTGSKRITRRAPVPSVMRCEVFRENRVSFAVLAVMWAVAIAAIVVLPDTVPAHWGSDPPGPDRWGSKLEVLVIPVLSTVPCLACVGAARVVKGETYGDGRSSELLLRRAATAIGVLLLSIELGILASIAVSL